MNVKMLPLQWYVDRLASGPRFSQGMYGDGEWICIFGREIGRCNAENTIYTASLCNELRQSLQFKHDGSFFFSVPASLETYGRFGEQIDRVTRMEFVDKDVWDHDVRVGLFGPLIAQLQKMKVCIISNANLRRLEFLRYSEFIELSYPNCYPEIEDAARRAIALGSGWVHLISAGLPAALLAQRIHAAVPDAFALDLGSVWDAFVGIGAQRGWRSELYADPKRYAAWLAQYESVGVPQRAL